ncbi:MAG: quinolinate synthase [Spirochaetia bacterium]|jgi:quinolinate synthase|nr:quinolinate synthase [Spirochaetia bacterium]
MDTAELKFKNYKNDDFKKYISDFKKRYKNRLIIPAHHYVPSTIIEFADLTGDSYKLAVEAAGSPAEWIVFCGVSFMAEGVEILTGEKQKVLVPDLDAGCPMADMIDRESGLKALDHIKLFSGAAPVPVVYMNSHVDSKSFCGEFDGAVCTSSNAQKIMNYYLSRGEKLFFIPDFNLGTNIARKTGLGDDEIALVKRDFTIEHKSQPEKIKLYLWDGMCPVHHKFTINDVNNFRHKYPEGKIIVHPEVKPEVASLADIQGSTQKIYDIISTSPAGSVWGVGTELTFVERLAETFKEMSIVSLNKNTCHDMSKNNISNLAESLYSIEMFENGKGELKYPVTVSEDYRENAKKALDKMIMIAGLK